MPSPDELPPGPPPLLMPGRPTLSRRNLLRGLGAGGAALAGGGLLSACGSGPVKSGEGEGTQEDLSDTDKTLTVSNWTLYIDRKKDPETGKRIYPTAVAFEEATGIDVTYVEDVNDNESFFAKIQPQLSASQPTGQDLFILTDWMASKLIRLGYLQKLDKANIPNGENIIDALASPSFDPNREYSLPWQSGQTAIGVNRNVYSEPITDMVDLLTNPDLAGRVTVLTEMRDTMGLIMLAQGNDPATFDDDDWNEAFAVIQEAVDNGHIRSFTGNDYGEGLAKGDILACAAWAGDVIQLQFDDPKIELILPESGSMLWADNMLIPNGSQHKKNAELWMNWYYQPEIAAELSAWVNYIPPVKGAKEAMKDFDPSLVDNPLIFPTDADLAQTAIFRGLSEDEETEYTKQYQSLYT